MTSPSTPDRLRIAYHEAGHAAVARALGLRIESVVIQLAGAGDSFAEIDCDPARLDHALAIKSLLAGGLAERRAGYPPEENSRSALDFLWAQGEAIEAAGGRGNPGVATRAEQLLEQLRAEVRELLERPDVWAGVERLAAELLAVGHVAGERAHQILAGV